MPDRPNPVVSGAVPRYTRFDPLAPVWLDLLADK